MSDADDNWVDFGVLRPLLEKPEGSGFALKLEPLRLQRPSTEDPTPPDYPAGSDLTGVPMPYWQCVTLLDHPGCGAVWTKERKVECPCGGNVGKVVPDPGLGIWEELRRRGPVASIPSFTVVNDSFPPMDPVGPVEEDPPGSGKFWQTFADRPLPDEARRWKEENPPTSWLDPHHLEVERQLRRERVVGPHLCHVGVVLDGECSCREIARLISEIFPGA